MSRVKDMTGQRFGRWLVLNRGTNYKDGTARWNVECECGELGLILGYELRSGKSKSCGCLNLELLKKRTKETMPHLGANFLTHGMVGTHFYSKWDSLKRRCKHDEGYQGRVTYSEEWESFDNFKADMYESYLHHVNVHGENETTLDRIKNNVGYSKDNCQWLTRHDNFAKNQRGER